MEKLSAKVKKQINKEICNLPTYHDQIPLQTIFNILEKHGIYVLQEDNTVWSGILIGNNEHITFEISHVSSAYIKENFVFYKPIENASLSLSWYKMSSGRYEITCYVG